MHFSIPDTQELKDENGTAYKVFNVHINGVLHCAVRYSQLHDLNEQLKQKFGTHKVPEFPPKRFLQLKSSDLTERRIQLEQYIQSVSQNLKLGKSEEFVNFLCRAQQETQLEEATPVSFEVSLLDGSKLTINIQSTDKTSEVLERVCHSLELPSKLTYYFGLFLVKVNSAPHFTLIRKLQEFECPYISLKCLQERRSYRIVLRKAYWDQKLDAIVEEDSVGLNLLKIQAENDLVIGWLNCSKETRRRLTNLTENNSKREYLHVCQMLPNYGCIRLNPCITNFPVKNTKTLITVGNYEFKFKQVDGEKEECFLVTKMRSWMLSSQFDRDVNTPKTDDPILQFCFEYLLDKGTFKWITMESNQAIMLSMCIKSMVDELLREKNNEVIKVPTDRDFINVRPTYKPRDKTTEGLFRNSDLQMGSRNNSGTIQKARDSVKKIGEKLSTVSILYKSADNAPSSVDSVTFNGHVSLSCRNSVLDRIGDDDL